MGDLQIKELIQSAKNNGYKNHGIIAKQLDTTRVTVAKWNIGQHLPSEAHVVGLAKLGNRNRTKALLDLKVDSSKGVLKILWIQIRKDVLEDV